MTAMPIEALRWRAAATDLNVTGALISDTKIQSAMFRIADRYERMAHSVEGRFLVYSRKMNLIAVHETKHINRSKISDLKDRAGDGQSQ
jgi:ribosomal protein L19